MLKRCVKIVIELLLAVCVDTAYRCFFPAQYMTDHLEANDDRFRVVALARDAYEIDRALEMALSE